MRRVVDGSFGKEFPEVCPDGGTIGANRSAFEAALCGEVPRISPYVPLMPGMQPEPYEVFDLLQFCARYIALPAEGAWHKFPQHHHLRFDRNEGLQGFVNDVNMLFCRNAMAFEMTWGGAIKRLGPPMLPELLQKRFNTGDVDTDRLLKQACEKILLPQLDDRINALQAIWDAFERIKTLDSENKKQGATSMLNKAASGQVMRAALENEARELTDLGNNLQIRHFEVTKERISDGAQVDHLFHRMLSFITLMLRKNGRHE